MKIDKIKFFFIAKKEEYKTKLSIRK